MIPEELIRTLTLKTMSGGGFWLGSLYLIVRYGADWWEWKCRGKFFYDLQDLAEEVQKKRGTGPRRPVRPLPKRVLTTRIRAGLRAHSSSNPD